MIVRWCALVVLTAVPLVLSAGVRCDFTTVISAPAYAYSGHLAIEGESARVDITDGAHPVFNPNMSIITRGRGAEIVVLDHARRTWFSRRGSGIAGHLGAVRGVGRTTASEPHVRTLRRGGEHHLIATYRLSMEIEGEKLEGQVELQVVSELGSGVRQSALPWGLQFAAKTGYDDVDRAITRRLPGGLPKRQVVTASRRIGDGAPVTESITTTLTGVVERPVGAELFFPPAGYRYEEPSFVFGGR